ncbi:MAG: endonuclease domain-containing protein [Clostridia bacterium]|nr:endonuclease domain-containing protein [Clostridia bacterium]
MKPSIEKNNKLLETARKLRREMTPWEKHLWYDFLQHYPIKIYKQRIIGNFIVDFYCHQAKLIIEIDGAGHYTAQGKSHDKARTDILKGHGFYVLRFSNHEIDSAFENVCQLIDKIT